MSDQHLELDSYVSHFASMLSRLDLGEIDQAAQILLDAYRAEATVFCIGNGGSASTASHFAADLGKYATDPRPGLRAMDLVSNVPALSAWTNDEDWTAVYRRMLIPWARTGDVVVAVSVHGGSGWSDNLVEGLNLAQERGLRTIGLSGAGGGDFLRVCDVNIVVPDLPDPLVTPLTESAHLLVTHLICRRLRDLL